MEDNQHFISYLNEYIKMPDPRYAVLLKGKWGCGKTYFIKEQIEIWSKKSKSKGDEIVLKPIYVSLYGLSTPIEITDKIRCILNPFLTSKGFKIAKNIFIGAISSTLKVDLKSNIIGKSSVSIDIDSLNLLEIKNEKIKGEKILIFDDLERCKIPLDILFGYVNNFVEHNQCKVIFIADEEKLEGKSKNTQGREETEEYVDYKNITYKDFKEKLIGQTFEIFPNYEKVINSFLVKINNNSLTENSKIVYDFFIATGTNNLRILRQCLFDFLRLEKLINLEIRKYPNYGEFIKVLIGYFVIFYCEYKSGNKNISSFQEFKCDYSSNNEYENNESFDNKYLWVINKYNFCEMRNILNGTIIIDFIERGNINNNILNLVLSQNVFFADIEINTIKKLKNYPRLSNSEFLEMYNEVKTNFENKRVNDIDDLFDICGILISLNNDDIISYSKENIIEIAKENIDNILSKSTNIINKRDEYYGFHLCSNTEEFKEISVYFNNKIREESFRIWEKYLKDYFENFDDNKCSNIFEKMNEESPFKCKNYEQTPIFKPIDINIFADKIMQLSNSSKNLFYRYLKVRYSFSHLLDNRTLENYHKGDLQSLIDLNKILITKINNSENIDKYVLNQLINTIDKAIDKIKSSPLEYNFPT